MNLVIPWKTWVFALVLLLAAVFLWNRERRLRTGAEAAAESFRLKLEHQIVETQSTRRELQASIDNLLLQDSELRSALELARKAAPDAKPASVSELDTGPVTIVHSTLHVRPPATTDGPAGSSPLPAGPSCVLTEADKLSLRAKILELQTGAGNTIVVGTAEAWRVGTPDALLASGRFQSALSATKELEKSSPPRWGVLALGACGALGCGPGVGVLLPPASALGLRLEAFAGAFGAPGGLYAVGGVGIRW